MMRHVVAGISLNSSIDIPDGAFATEDDSLQADIQLTASAVSASSVVKKEQSPDDVAVCSTADGAWLFADCAASNGAKLLASGTYSELKADDAFLRAAPERQLRLLRLPIECRFCHAGTVSLHAACIEVGGQAVCFTGDSGVGKSTRADAWRTALGAEFISGDRPAIRLNAGNATACGVPWDGKEQIFRNVERPLKAILEVRRAPFTMLRKLSEEQAYAVLIRQSFIPMWDADTAALAMANVRKLAKTVPVCRLFCGPSADDAKAAHEILFHSPKKIKKEASEMQIKEGFILRHVGDEHMVMPTGANVAKFGGAVVLTDVAAFIFDQLKQPIAKEDLLKLVVAEFEVDEETARSDLDELVESFREMGLMEA